MSWLRWLPWRFLVRRVAYAHGFIDPVALLARLEGLAQPSEVAQPVELLRAGVVFHARGLINSRVIQHNLDWVWPFWIERQFDPEDPAFVPRAFSITHVNLTHRNWTAVGVPDVDQYPLVDPRGLLTPQYDGWSLDTWVVSDQGIRLLPSRADRCSQSLTFDGGLAVTTQTDQEGFSISSRSLVEMEAGIPVCRLRVQARSDTGGWLVLSLRPYNSEGISFIHKVQLSPDRSTWKIDGEQAVRFDTPAQRHHVSNYRAGDVHIHLDDIADQHQGECDVGMVTAAAMFVLDSGEPRNIRVTVPLPATSSPLSVDATSWTHSLQGHCKLSVPDARFQFLYDAAVRTLILLSPGDVYPGPYTYKRFWFRDAAFIIHGLLCVGLTARAERALDAFPSRQTRQGYFHSQEGEWDSNGQALWIFHRFCEITGSTPKQAWREAIVRGARWIVRKRLAEHPDTPHAGLLPAGFSAEHLGPNDYYFWDDFWGISGLNKAAELCRLFGDALQSKEFALQADAFHQAVDLSLARSGKQLGRIAMPASPYRRMDAGAIGSLAAGYPTQLHSPDDPRLLDTVEFLLDRCFVAGGFFQDMIHAGINPYLTLHVAQVLLRAGDSRYLALMDTVAALASSTGQWPEAIHPQTSGGCMGDGQHVWAAAEWIMMIRHCFVREEGSRLLLCQGVLPRWLTGRNVLTFGPAPTAFGKITLELVVTNTGVNLSWQAKWHGSTSPAIEVRLPGYEPAAMQSDQTSVELCKVIR